MPDGRTWGGGALGWPPLLEGLLVQDQLVGVVHVDAAAFLLTLVGVRWGGCAPVSRRGEAGRPVSFDKESDTRHIIN